MVCRTDAFRDVGGFNQELYAADEITFSQELAKWGQQRGLEFSILTRHPLETSPRKVLLNPRRKASGTAPESNPQPAPFIAGQEAVTDLV